MPPTLDCLIVGAGPAGLTAAMYLRRFHRTVMVVCSGAPRAARIPLSHNVPGFPDGIGGEALLGRLRQQLAHVDGKVHSGQVKAVSQHGEGGFTVRTEHSEWHARTVLMATGSRDHEADIQGIQAVRQSGLLRECPICDGYEFSDQRIGVIGLSAHGVREALFLRHFSKRVWLLSVEPQAAPAPDLQSALRARETPWRASGIRQLSVGLDGLVLVQMNDGEEIACDVLYSALGCHPGSELAREMGAACDEVGNLIVDCHCQTNMPGLYAAGDVTGGLDQIAVAMGQGAIAATAIHNSL